MLGSACTEPRSDAAPLAGSEQAELRLSVPQAGEHAGAVELHGIPEPQLERLRTRPPSPAEWQRIFALYTRAALAGDDPSLPPLLGEYRIEKDHLLFLPRFPLVAGLDYVARLDAGALFGGVPGPASLDLPLALERQETSPTTVVEAVYPTVSRLPENQLKFTLQFSAPMRKGEAYEHVRLVAAGGDEVELPFLEVDQELWDRTGTRFTLFIHPGRIKRGLRPNAELGPPLRAGESYRLVVSREWRDGRGEPLREPFETSFDVLPADRDSPDPSTWRIDAPRASSREPVTVHFDEPLDRVLLERVVRVTRRRTTVPGEVTIPPGERSWSLVPAEPWQPGEHGLEAEPILEDLAGNNLRGLFDIERGVDQPEQEAGTAVRIPFVVR